MMRPTIFGSLMGLLLSGGVTLSPLMKTDTDQPPQASVHDAQLADSLSSLNTTLVSFEARQSGSERQLTEQLQSLASVVADTRTASQSQIDALVKSLAEVRQVAAQPADTSAFQSLLDGFSKDFEKRLDTKVQTLVNAEVEEAIPADKGVGTLDVDDVPKGDDRPQDFADAAARIVKLEKEVAALKARSVASTSSTATSSGSTYYPATVVSSSSGGSTGSYSYSQPAYRSQPVYYSAPQSNYYQQPTYSAPQATVRRGWFGRSYSAPSYGTCRMVNGQMICN